MDPLVGTVIGGAIAASAGFAGQLYLDGRRTRRGLRAAAALVARELEENASYLALLLARGQRVIKHESVLTATSVGAWEAYRAPLVPLYRRDGRLWESLGAVYAELRFVNEKGSFDAALVERIRAVAGDLDGHA